MRIISGEAIAVDMICIALLLLFFVGMGILVRWLDGLGAGA